MLKEFFSSSRKSKGRSPGSFWILAVLFFIPSTALWFFYRQLFQADASVAGMLSLAMITALLWAYLIGYGKEQHTAEITS